jgi:hypothetical protein
MTSMILAALIVLSLGVGGANARSFALVTPAKRKGTWK